MSGSLRGFHDSMQMFQGTATRPLLKTWQNSEFMDAFAICCPFIGQLYSIRQQQENASLNGSGIFPGLLRKNLTLRL